MNKYIEISSVGLSCYADSYIISEDNFLFYISLFGRPALIKAMTATILAGKSVYVGGRMVAKASNKAETFTQNLGGGLVHKVILSSEHFKGSDARIIIGKDRELAFLFLDSIVSTPLKKEWADWLWGKVFAPEPLRCFGSIGGQYLSEAWLIRLTKTIDEIDELVLDGLKNSQIN